MTKHTSGPGIAGPHNGDYGHSVSADDELIHIADLPTACYSEHNENQANAPELLEALKPFAHPDLHELLGGNVQGDDSIVFQRNGAFLTIGDFRRASAAIAKAKGPEHIPGYEG